MRRATSQVALLGTAIAFTAIPASASTSADNDGAFGVDKRGGAERGLLRERSFVRHIRRRRRRSDGKHVQLVQRNGRLLVGGRLVGGQPLDVEDMPTLWGLPKILWVVVADVFALCTYLAGVRYVTIIAKHKQDDDGQDARRDEAPNYVDPIVDA
mmetsp:Transcript_105882/g.297718  ORF Transcript_105882/g.297718 Transcript_105882/m.297718 type:complete len:155 (+) Transcript_105882:112-576(+)